MVKIIAIIGEAGTGKDFLVKELVKRYPELFHEIVSCTTRPKREKEYEGVNYYFLTQQQFLTNVINGRMLESTNFRGWYYGTLLDSLSQNKINLGVFNPAGVRSLIKNDNVEVVVYRLTVSKKERLLRQLNREENPDVDEIIRRYGTDNTDFGDIDFDYIELENSVIQNLAPNMEAIVSKARADWDNKS